MNKKLLAFAAAATLMMAFNASASAQIVTDAAGQQHYVMCAQGQEAQFDAGAKYVPHPVNEVLEMTDAEYTQFSNTEGNMNGKWHKAQRNLRPVNEVMNMTDAEYTQFSNRSNADSNTK